MQEKVVRKKTVRALPLFSILLSSMALLIATDSALAGHLQGRLNYRGPSRTAVAAPYIQVTLVDAVHNSASSTYTGSDGMYYFYNVPPGQYTLEIRTSEGKPSLSFRITVRDQPHTSIAPILIPRR